MEKLIGSSLWQVGLLLRWSETKIQRLKDLWLCFTFLRSDWKVLSWSTWCCWAFEAEVEALRLMFPVVGWSVLYVLRLAGGPEGNMPKTFCWTEPVNENRIVKLKLNTESSVCVMTTCRDEARRARCVRVFGNVLLQMKVKKRSTKPMMKRSPDKKKRTTKVFSTEAHPKQKHNQTWSGSTMRSVMGLRCGIHSVTSRNGWHVCGLPPWAEGTLSVTILLLAGSGSLAPMTWPATVTWLPEIWKVWSEVVEAARHTMPLAVTHHLKGTGTAGVRLWCPLEGLSLRF